MRKLIGKTLLLLTLFAATVAVVWRLPYPDPEMFTLASLAKRQRLHESAPPRIILVGGSNLAFGVDSALLARETGLPVVNMGLHYDLGLRQMLDEVEPWLGRGDTVLIVPEYLLFFGSYLEGGDTMVQVKLLSPGDLARCSLRQWWRVAGRLLPETARKVEQSLFPDRAADSALYRQIYRRSGFNRLGDLTTHLHWTGIGFGMRDVHQVVPDEPFNPESVDRINRFADAAKRSGARCLLLYPPLPAGVFRRNILGIMSLDRKLRESLHVPISFPPEESTFSSDLFFDTVYHLDENGRPLFTRLMGRALGFP